MSVKRFLGYWLVLVLTALLLVACSDGSATTTVSRPALAAQPVAVNTPAQVAATSGAVAVAPPPTTQPARPANPVVTTLPATKPAQSPTPKPPLAAVGAGIANSFYELPYANSEFFVHVPATLKAGQPAQVVLAVHGMGGNGQQFGSPLIAYADRYNFVLVAPDLKYDENYFDPEHIAANDSVLLPELDSLLTALPAQIHLTLNPKVLLFGFSRGAQIVHRFAFFYPEKVRGVAAISAGNYTLPEQEMAANNPANAAAKISLPFPFGVADLATYSGRTFNMVALRQIPFWIGVGGADNATKDVPPAWSPFLGQTRIERATRFYQALQSVGINATFTVFPGVGHAVCTEMKQGAFAFFDKLVA